MNGYLDAPVALPPGNNPGKGQVHPRKGNEGPKGEWRYSCTLTLTSVLDVGGWVVNAAPRLLYPQERPGTHCTGGWVGPRAVLDRVRKVSPSPRFDPRTVQPVTSRYTG
jgi:hypothetical protein